MIPRTSRLRRIFFRTNTHASSREKNAAAQVCSRALLQSTRDTCLRWTLYYFIDYTSSTYLTVSKRRVKISRETAQNNIVSLPCGGLIGALLMTICSWFCRRHDERTCRVRVCRRTLFLSSSRPSYFVCTEDDAAWCVVRWCAVHGVVGKKVWLGDSGGQ